MTCKKCKWEFLVITVERGLMECAVCGRIARLFLDESLQYTYEARNISG